MVNKKTRKKKGANKPGYDFIVAQLNKNPSIDYPTIRERADKKNLPVFPIMYGRAKAQLGLVPSGKKKAAKKKRRTSSAGGTSRKKRVARASRRSSALANGSLTGLVDDIKAMDDQNGRLTAALTEISKLVESVL